MNYTVFDSSQLFQFRNVMLPDIYSQLLVTPSFEEAGLACIGAMESGQAAGAVVLGFQEDNIVSILSLYVRKDMRGRGIGSELINRAVAAAAETMTASIGPIRFGIEMEYTIKAEEKEQFTRFLEKNHFSFHMDNGKIYVLSAKTCRKYLQYDMSGVSSLNESSGVSPEEVGALLEDQGINADPEYCFIYGNPQDPDMMLVAEYGTNQDFNISSLALKGQKIGRKEYLAVLTKAVDEIAKNNPDAVLIASNEKNCHPDIWEKLAAAGGRTYVHATAGLAIRM